MICGRFSVDEEPNPTICRAAHAGLDILPDRSESAAPPPDFYQVIVTNNLFRALGWTPPKPPPPFKLMTTVMKSNGRHKALLRNTGDRKLYYVVVGEVVGGATVEKIEARRVTLNRDGESVVYRLSLFDDGQQGVWEAVWVH